MRRTRKDNDLAELLKVITIDAHGDDEQLRAIAFDVSRPIDLVVLALKSNALRCRIPGTEREMTLRTAVRWEVPGEIVTVLPTKQWTHAGHPYLSGKVQSSRLDVRSLGLVPLELKPEGDWDPEDEYWGDADWAKPIEFLSLEPLLGPYATSTSRAWTG